MSSRVRPIWGFGVWGVLLLGPAGYLAWCLVTGYDLRVEIMDVWIRALGWKSLSYTFLFKGIHPHSYTINQATFNTIALAYCLVALHLAPKPRSWLCWVAVVAWAVVCPMLARPWDNNWGLTDWPRWIEQHWAMPALLPTVTATQILTVGLVWLLTRGGGWRYSAVAGVATISAFFLSWANASAVRRGAPELYVITTGWHAAIAGALWWWAITERRHACREAWQCEACDYDLRGLPTGTPRCPECGAAMVGESKAPAAADIKR